MSTLNFAASRKNDQRILTMKVHIDKVCDYATLAILQDDQPVEVFSTSVGSIRDQQIVVYQPAKSSVDIIAKLPSEESECIISYFENDEIIDSESLPIALEKMDVISEEAVDTVSINASLGDFNTRLDAFCARLV